MAKKNRLHTFQITNDACSKNFAKKTRKEINTQKNAYRERAKFQFDWIISHKHTNTHLRSGSRHWINSIELSIEPFLLVRFECSLSLLHTHTHTLSPYILSYTMCDLRDQRWWYYAYWRFFYTLQRKSQSNSFFEF